ncbi:monovalent cation:proton antiporter-2 (CPA2) family protein [Maritimibacter sp. UBA3975]|uniref:monovalent cation:proton antiporter-2 (CPA2) family protein n=1 Tax=Maritimibacter sp. UBA3975 TaxID=1946833 RepID=UPI000C0A6667|nr:monovalent cation:proton antiporter-2 (CPA2) family protein [Maritimibacter sp. UBA3975]MAM61048.1 potassium transporter [Maritimibacter sp.]|tara:strand:- start:8256 stop:10154 length:1899 start_codon:yes stop_codon:yes gene_type:complete
METFLLNATIYLGAAVIAVPIAARLGLGSVLGYLVAGLLIGPITGIDGGETEGLMHFAEFGVVMMLFLIGLELDPGALWDMRHRLMGLGGLQVVLTTAVVTGAVMIMGESWQVSLAIGLMLALSSTAIVLQTLTEKGLMQSAGGRSSFSVLLTQDIAVIPMLVLVPLLATGGGSHGVDDHSSVSIVENLPSWGVALVTLGAVAAIILAGRYLVRPLFRFIESARLREMYTAVALLIVVGIATLMNVVGLSPALGAFLAGVMLANSEFRHELETDIEPFKGLLLGLFFITVGAGMDVRGFIADPVRLIGLATLLMAAKAAVLAPLGLIFNLRGRDLWLFTLGLAQAGEFGFLLVTFSLQQGVITNVIGQDVLTVIALSMLLTPLAFIVHDFYAKRSKVRVEATEADEIDEHSGIIIVGIGRFGQVVNRLVRSVGFKTTVLDNNLQTIQMMRKFGVKGFFGDPTRPDLLKAAGLETAKVLVVAVNNADACMRIVAHARAVRPDIHIIARARDRTHVYGLYQAGANDIVREMFDSSLRVGRYVLENVGLSEFEANEAERMFYKHDRHMIRELANYWDPNLRADENEAYRERSMALDRDMESAMLTQLLALDQEPKPSRDDDREDDDDDTPEAKAS